MGKALRDPYIAIFLFLTTLILFFHSLPFPMVIDDNFTIVTNKEISNLHPWTKFFLNKDTVAIPHSGINGTIYRPLCTLSFALNYIFSGLSPWTYRFVNLLLHAFNGCLLYYLIRRRYQSLFIIPGVLVFLFHPVQVESVVWITQRSILMATTGVLLSLHVWEIGKIRRGYLFLLPPVFGLALLSKETAIGLPVYLMLDLIKQKSIIQDEKIRNSRLLVVVICGLMSLIYLPLRHAVLGVWGQGISELSQSDSILRSISALGLYLKNVIWPFQLNVNYRPPELLGLTHPLVLIGIIMLMVTIITFLRFRKDDSMFMGCILLILFWFPHSGIIPNVTYAADRFMYLPLVGITFILVSLTTRIKKTYFIYVLFLMSMILSGITFIRMMDWRSEKSLWEASLAVDSENASSWAAYAYSFCLERKLEEAQKYFLIALAKNPSPLLRQDIFKSLAIISEWTNDKRAANHWWHEFNNELDLSSL